LSRLPYEEAEARIVSGIQHYNTAKGNSAGYHHTITLAFARLISSRLAGTDWPGFLAANPDLLTFACLQRHYSIELLRSDRARAEFVEPDLEPLVSEGETSGESRGCI
jgi:hypothetical protein